MSSAIRRATEADLPEVRSMLEDAGLPTRDLTVAHLAFVTAEGDRIAGAIGIESFGDVGLLRSLVVATDARSSGLGRALVTALENDASGAGIRELWLLTIDADAYFRRLGFLTRDRADAPDGIRGTAEFSSLCPGDAVLMSKTLQEPATRTTAFGGQSPD